MRERSNIVYFRYYLLTEPTVCYVGIIFLSVFQSASKSFNDFMASLYNRKSVYMHSRTTTGYVELICIVSQLVRMVGYFLTDDTAIFFATTLVQSLFHHSVHTEINSVTLELIRTIGRSSCK